MFSARLSEREQKEYFDKINYHVTKLSKEAKSIAGGKCVLVLGPCSSGKSTFVNYMMGSRMKEQETDLYETIIIPQDAKKEELCKVGRGVDVQTLYPQVVSSGNGFDYVDCAGFSCGDDLSEAVRSTLFTQMIVRQSESESVKGIVCCINYYTCIEGQASYFDNVCDALSLVKNLSDYTGSILFLITKAPDRINEGHIQRKFKQLLDDTAKIHRDYLHPDRVKLLNMLLDNKKNVCLFRPTDERQREVILSDIQKFKSISKKQFLFPISHPIYAGFEKSMLRCVMKVTEAMQKGADPMGNAINGVLTSDLDFICEWAKKIRFNSDVINGFPAVYEQYQNRNNKEKVALPVRCVS